MVELTPEAMLAVRAMAPFEVAEVFEEWCRRARADMETIPDPIPEVLAKAAVGGHGVPCPMECESDAAFGRRMAAGLFILIKEL